MAEPIALPFGLWTRVSRRKQKFNRIRQVAPMCQTAMSSAVQKLLNQLICHFGCGLEWAEGSTSSIVFSRWHQCALPWGHIGATWRIWLNRPPAAAMQLYVKLLWPLVIFITINDHLVVQAQQSAYRCVFSQQLQNKMTFDTDIWHAASPDPI